MLIIVVVLHLPLLLLLILLVSILLLFWPSWFLVRTACRVTGVSPTCRKAYSEAECTTVDTIQPITTFRVTLVFEEANTVFILSLKNLFVVSIAIHSASKDALRRGG